MDNEKLYEDMKPKEKFEVLWAESGLADRPGAENLWQQMVALGFFEKPASIKHHSNHPGGLCEHSVCVAEAAMELCRTNHAFKKCHRNEVLAAALLHDYCKVGKYRDKGKGEYEYFDAGLVGHGEGSVIMAALHQADGAGDRGDSLAHGSIQRVAGLGYAQCCL